MATTGLYKIGDGSKSATNSFPASNLCTSKGAGHWVLAHRATPRAWTEKGTSRKTPQQRRKPPKSPFMGNNHGHRVLDEPFLMQHHRLKNPSDLCSVNISSQNLVSAKEDDFEKFDGVTFINAAENLLTLEPFRKFPALRELELSLNGLSNVKITAGDFLHLEHLDLSYNNLSPQDIGTLGHLSQLKVLRLTANGLRSLPLDLHSPPLKFPSLEVLALDDNRLSDPSIFVSLSHLRRLKELNLDRNRISAVPHLPQAESRSRFLHPALDHNSFGAQWCRSLSSLWPQSRPSQRESMEVPGELEAKKEVSESGSQEHPAQLVPNGGEPSASKPLLAPSTRRSICAPFPELRSLSLAFNKIADEAALLPVAFFPSLKELTFHSNPLTSTRSGQLPLLTWLLQHNLGIQLLHQQSPAMERRHLRIPLKGSRKVTSHLPKVTKQPWMLEAPAKTFLGPRLPDAAEAVGDAPGPAQPLLPSSSMTPASSQRVMQGGEEGGSQEGDAASFFMTQVQDVSRPLQRPGAGTRLERRSERRKEGSSRGVPEQYKGCEELPGGGTDPDLVEPLGIQRKAQALHQVPNHPLGYRDAEAQLDCVQKPCVPRKKHVRMPGPPARKTKAEILEGILLAMRNTQTFTEVPLATVLQGRKSKRREYREARRLMEEFQEVFGTSLLVQEVARPSHEAQVAKALPSEAASNQPQRAPARKEGAQEAEPGQAGLE